MGTPLGNSGIFRSDSNGTVEIVRQGSLAPDGDGTFAAFRGHEDIVSVAAPYAFRENARMFRFALNNGGQVAFLGQLQGTQNSRLNTGVYLADGDSIVQIAKAGQLVGDAYVGNTYAQDPFFQLQLNDAGQVSFRTSGAIWKSDGSSLEVVAIENQIVADDAGSIAGIRDYFQMNDSGRIAILADLIDLGGRRKALFEVDEDEIKLLVHTGQSAPDGDGELDLSFTRSFAFNDAGQIAFVANVQNASPSAHQGLFLYDPNEGLIQVARTGKEYLGSWFNIFTLTTNDADNQEGLNNLGQIAFRFQLYDRREGIALWTPVPEPSSVFMLIVMSVALYFTVRSRRIA